MPLVAVVPRPLVAPLTVLPLCVADALARVLETPLVPLTGTPLPLLFAAAARLKSGQLSDL